MFERNTRLIALSLLCVAAGCVHAPANSPTETTAISAIHAEPDGRRYRIEPVPNIPSKFYWIDKDTVRYFPLSIYKVESHDEQYLYIKQYIVDAQAKPVLEKAIVSPAHVGLPISHRFVLKDFGHGLPHVDQWRNDFTIADINVDGHPDIVSAPARKSLAKPVIFLGDGQGNWQRWQGTTFPNLPYDYGAVAVADFNGDGVPDLALAMHLRGMTVLTGDGKGHFTRYDRNLPLSTPGTANPVTFSSTAIEAIDWNGDGKIDVVALSEGLLGAPQSYAPAGLTTFLNAGADWSPASIPAIENAARAATLTRVAADPAQQTKLIAVSGSGSANTTVYESAAGHWEAHKVDVMPKGAIVRAVTAADLNGDGSVALVLSYQVVVDGIWHSAVDAFYPSHGAYTRRALHDEASRLSFGALALGHLSSRSSWDLVALRDDGTMMLFAADGHGFFTRDLESPAPAWRAGCAASAVHLRDIDGDGIEEIVAAFAGEPNAAALDHSCMQGGGIDAWKISPPN